MLLLSRTSCLLGFVVFANCQNPSDDPCTDPTAGCDSKFGSCSPSMSPDSDVKFNCLCEEGFVLDANGKTCNCEQLMLNDDFNVKTSTTLVVTKCPDSATSGCDPNATCTPTIDNSTNSALFVCSCKDGFTGNGSHGGCKEHRLEAIENTTATTSDTMKPTPTVTQESVSQNATVLASIKRVPQPPACMNEATACNDQGYERPDKDERPTFYLDRHMVSCSKDKYYLNGFKVSRCGEHKFQIKYSCCSIRFGDDNITSVQKLHVQQQPVTKVLTSTVCMDEATVCNEQGYERADKDERPTFYLDRHMVSCTKRQYYLNGFRIWRCDEHHVQIKYTCCKIGLEEQMSVSLQTVQVREQPLKKVPSPAVCMNEETLCNEQGYERADHDERPTYYLDLHLVRCSKDKYFLNGFKIARCGANKFQIKYTCCYINISWV